MWMRLAARQGRWDRGASWLAPVEWRLTVLETTPSERHPDRGTIRIRGEMVNQDGVTVMSMVSRGRFGRRSPQ